MVRSRQNKEAGRAYAGESAPQRLARQRRQFLDAGMELFGTVGYRATSVRALCKQARLTDRYFYKNFHDTEDLLAAVYSESMDQIQTEVMRAIAESPAAERPGDLIRVGLDAFFAAIENARVARVCWLEVLGVSPRIDEMYTRRVQQFADLMLILARGMLPSWPLADEEARVTGIAVVGAVSQSALHWLLEDYRTARETLVSANGRLIRGLIDALPK
ncbi:MAG: TetR/AcrR family transcriptional regulator [Alcanivoracaceae bacterium]|jgi:AcrR family transcriptional regulator|nr:TetR/AcrR family transcriptional regulator [Alcanivoracaceae bacterium]